MKFSIIKGTCEHNYTHGMVLSHSETGGMQYLMSRPMDTTDSASPQLKRSSKVLSIFVDSEDVLEGIGDGLHLDSTNNCKQLPEACGSASSCNCCEKDVVEQTMHKAVVARTAVFTIIGLHL